MNGRRCWFALASGPIFLAAFMVNGCNKVVELPALTPKVILVLLDGIPADVLESARTPNLDDIAAKSGYTRAYIGGTPGEQSESPTVSAAGYASVLTGTWSYKHNVWDNQIGEPNYDYWDIFRIAKAHNPSLHSAIFSTWTDNRTKLLGDGLEAAGGNKFDYFFDGFELDTERFPHDAKDHYIRDIDELVTDEAARYINAEGPDLSWVYLQHTDDIGHEYGDGTEMTAAVEFMDGQVGKIWNAVQMRQRSHSENWLILVTTDHGRDAETGRDHGRQSERERTTWIITNSDSLNARFAVLPASVDILPSIAVHLQLDIPEHVQSQLDGQSFID